MNFKFANLLGAPYRGGNIILHGSDLLSPVGNRVSQVNLAHSTSQTLPFENLKQIRTLCLSPDGRLLLSIDADGRALLVQRQRRVLLHHVSFRAPVAVAKFSPDGKYVALGVGKLLQVWHTPSTAKQMAPMQLHRSYGGCHDTITSLDWSPDSQFIAVASKDLTARVYSLNPIEGYVPPTLAGHKDALVGVFFTSAATQQAAELQGQPPPLLYTVSRDGALYGWSMQPVVPAGDGGDGGDVGDGGGNGDGGADANGDDSSGRTKRGRKRKAAGKAVAAAMNTGAAKAGSSAAAGAAGSAAGAGVGLAGGVWRLTSRHYFLQRGARLTCADLHAPSGVLVAGFSHGLFELLQLPEAAALHTLSASRESLSAAAFNASGDWLALGCAPLGQLLVWEWRSETYVLKQQGHYYDVAAAAFSPDGALLATGADDAKLKVFNLTSGFCFVTFSEHAAPVTAVAFAPSGAVVLSASLDGSVRAFDLLRYRNFRTMTAPEPTQFASLAVDPAGDIVAAGGLDNFSIYLWSLKTGRLLDVLSGHEGPVSGLAFAPAGTPPGLASVSWDKTARLWDVYGGDGQLEALAHSHDALSLAYRPDGRQLAVSTLDGSISLWDVREARLDAVIEGRRDVRGGRLASDRRAANNLASGAAFTSLAYNADGSLLFAGGASKFVCVYDVAERVLLRRFSTTTNRSLDGVLDTLNSKDMTDAGPLRLIDAGDDDDAELLPPGGNPAAEADVPGAPRRRPVARTRALALSPTGRAWAAATTEGVLLYTLDGGLVFDPTDLTEELTPAAFEAALAAGSTVRALLIALRLKDGALLRRGLFSVPLAQVANAAGALPAAFLVQVLQGVAECLGESAHAEFLLRWVQALLAAHGPALQAAAVPGGGGGGGSSTDALPAMRQLQQVVGRLHRDLAGAADGNVYLLEYVCAARGATLAAAEAGATAEEVAAAAAARPAAAAGG